MAGGNTRRESRIFALATLGDTPTPTPAVTIATEGLTYSSDQRWLVITQDGGWQFYDLATLSDPPTPTATISGDQYRFSADAAKLAVYAEANSEVRFFDLATDALSDTGGVVIANVTGSNFGFNPAGTVLVLPTETGLDFWDVATQERTSYSGTVDGYSWQFSPDGTRLLLDTSSCYPGYCAGGMRVIDASTQAELFTTTYEGSYAEGQTFSSDGKLFAYGLSATGSWSTFNQQGTTFSAGVLHVIDLETGDERFTLTNETGILGSISFNSDNTRLLYSTISWLDQNPNWEMSAVHLVNVANGEEEWVKLDRGLSAGYSDDERFVYTNYSITLPGFWILRSGSTTPINAATGADLFGDVEVNDYAISPDASFMVATVTESNQLSFYDGASAELLGQIAVEGATALGAAQISPDGALLLTQYSQGEDPDTKNYIVLFRLPVASE